MFNDPARRAVVDETMTHLAAATQGVELLDLRAWVESDTVARRHDARPDGLHWTPLAALDVVQRWLGPRLTTTDWETP
jgi:hypothetical protein